METEALRELDLERNQLPQLLQKSGLVGIELGVATGDYSAKLWKTGLFSQLWGVDAYGDHHDTKEYVSALSLVGLDANYRLLRMYFDEALALFPDAYFDFVYIDGYAHTGEDAGKTLYQWLPKVKVGGMIAGHDYHAEWPFVVMSVDRFAGDANLDLMITGVSSDPGPQDRFPSWSAIKSSNDHIPYPSSLATAVKEAQKLGKERRNAHPRSDGGLTAYSRPWRRRIAKLLKRR